jgi:hypothetical protein
MITCRDLRLIKFIDDFTIASTRNIHELYFADTTLRRCQERLSRLVEQKRLMRDRIYTQEYVYFLKKPSQVEHMLQRVDAFITLRKTCILNEFVPEYTYGDLRADAYFETWKEPGIVTRYFLEVQRNEHFDQQKYEAAYGSEKWSEKWRKFPKVVILSEWNIKLKPSEVEYIVTDGIDKICHSGIIR